MEVQVVNCGCSSSRAWEEGFYDLWKGQKAESRRQKAQEAPLRSRSRLQGTRLLFREGGDAASRACGVRRTTTQHLPNILTSAIQTTASLSDSFC
jgi:hypothetical protein